MTYSVPINVSDIPVATERLVAQWLRSSGRKTVESNGRVWMQIVPGIYQTVCLLSTSPDTAPAFGKFALGWRAALHTRQAYLRNGSIPVYLWDDLGSFSISCLSSKSRNSVKKGLKSGTFELMTDPSLLWSQGFDVYLSYLERTRLRRRPSLAEYRRGVEALFDEWHIVIGAFWNGKLAGYIDGYTVDGVGYGEYLILASEVRQFGLGSALLYQMMMAYKQGGKTHTMMNGLQTPELPELHNFKRRFGFKMVDVPATVACVPPVKIILRALAPSKAFRFFGSPRT